MLQGSPHALHPGELFPPLVVVAAVFSPSLCLFLAAPGVPAPGVPRVCPQHAVVAAAAAASLERVVLVLVTAAASLLPPALERVPLERVVAAAVAAAMLPPALERVPLERAFFPPPPLVEGWQRTLCFWVRAAPSQRAMPHRGLLLPPLVVVAVVAVVGW